MCDKTNMEIGLELSPEDDVLRSIYADYLEENGKNLPAKIQREIVKVIRGDKPLEYMRNNYYSSEPPASSAHLVLLCKERGDEHPPKQVGDVDWRFVDAIAYFFCIEEGISPIAPSSPSWMGKGDIVTHTIHGYFKDIDYRGHSDCDVCNYCGYCNSCSGGRKGWDCLHCGAT